MEGHKVTYSNKVRQDCLFIKFQRKNVFTPDWDFQIFVSDWVVKNEIIGKRSVKTLQVRVRKEYQGPGTAQPG